MPLVGCSEGRGSHMSRRVRQEGQVDVPVPRVLVIVEGSGGGHRLSYVAQLVGAGLRAGLDVHLLTSPGVVNSREFAMHLRNHRDDMTVVDDQIPALRRVRQYATAHGPCHVVVPDGDRMALRVGASGRWRSTNSMSILIMRDPRIESPTSFLRVAKLSLKLALIRRAQRLPRVKIYWLRSAGTFPAYDTADCIEDPVTLTHTPVSVCNLRREWRLDEDRFWFGVVGALSARKNIDLICQALSIVNRPVGLLIAGEPSSGFRLDDAALERLMNAGVIVRRVLRSLTDAEVDSALAALDCALIVHTNEGPSGILGKCMAIGTRVVVGGALSLRRDIEQVGSGRWVPLATDRLAVAMEQAVDDDRPAVAIAAAIPQLDRLLR